MKIILLPLLLLSSLTAFADDATWLADARKVATSVPPKLLQVLTDEIAKGGPESAIEVCRERHRRWQRQPLNRPAGAYAA
jgi:hypothetical protein